MTSVPTVKQAKEDNSLGDTAEFYIRKWISSLEVSEDVLKADREGKIDLDKSPFSRHQSSKRFVDS